MNENDEYRDAELPADISSVLERMRDRPVQDISMDRVLDRFLIEETAEADTSWPATSRSLNANPAKLGAFLALAASLLIIASAVWLALRTDNAWADVADAVGGKHWVRLTATDSETWTYESWFAPSRQILASRIGDEMTYVNVTAGERFEFDSKNNKLYRLPLVERESANSLDTIRDLMTSREIKLGSKFSGFTIIEQQSQTVEHDERSWRETELKLERDHHSLTMVIRVDPDKNLPVSVDMTFNGQKRSFSVDYPEVGPEDIYDLGVSRDIRIVDRIPPKNVSDVLARLNEGHKSFSDYAAIIGNERGVPSQLIRRRGKKWRLDRCVPTDRMQPLADDMAQVIADTKDDQWWMDRMSQYDLQPMLVCDGKFVYRYPPEDRPQPVNASDLPKQGEVIPTPGALFPLVRSIRVADPSAPARIRRGGRYAIISMPETYHLIVEGFAYPPFKASSDFETSLRPTGDDGPEGTLVLQFEAVVPSKFLMYRKTRRWLDPKLRYAVVKEENLGCISIDNPHAPFRHLDQTDQIREFDEFRESPNGYFYPTVVRWKNVKSKDGTSGKTRDITTFFHLDFNADMPNSLFEVSDATNQIEGESAIGQPVGSRAPTE